MKKIFVYIFVGFSAISLVSAGCSIKKVNKDSQTSQTSAIQYPGKSGSSALNLLREKYRVETQSFATGEFVKSINGVAPDTNHYWAYFVNGQQSTVSASQYITKDGESIEWKLEQISPGL